MPKHSTGPLSFGAVAAGSSWLFVLVVTIGPGLLIPLQVQRL